MTWHIPEGMSESKAEKEAMRQAILFEEKVRNVEVLGGVIKFKDFVEQWFRDYADAQLRLRTIESYREYLPRINAEIGHIRIDQLRPQHLIRFYNKLAEPIVEKRYKCIVDFKALLEKKHITQAKCAQKCGVTAHVLRSIREGKLISHENAQKVSEGLKTPQKKLFEEVATERFLSEKSRRNYHAFISSVLSWAVKWQVIPSNPAERVQPPKVHKKEAVYLDDKQALDLLAALDGEPLQQRTAI